MSDRLILDFAPGPGYWNARIRLGTHSGDESGKRFLTPDCATIGEIRAQISSLHEELDEAKADAERAFADHPGRPPIELETVPVPPG